MKGTIFIRVVILLSVALLGAGTAWAQGSRYGSGGLGCPGRQGVMGGMSCGINDSGPLAGWIKDGGTMQPGCRGPEGPMTKFDAQLALRNYVTRDPNVQLGSIRDKGDNFEADVIAKDRALVGRITVEKATGWIRSIY
jgi:hypothetical protein